MSSIAQKPSIVLAHGSYHTPAHYDIFVSHFRKLGYPHIVCPQLPSATDETPDDPSTAFSDDVAVLHAALRSELLSGRDVVLLAHSYGGAPSSEAPYGLPPPSSSEDKKPAVGRLLGIIFVTALVLDVGQSLLTSLTGDPPPWVRVDDAHVMSWTHEPGYYFYTDTPNGPEKDAAIANMRKHVFPAFAGEVAHAAWKDLQCVYVKCNRDLGVVPEYQAAQIRKMQEDGPGEGCLCTTAKGKGGLDVVELECDHVPFLSMPEQVAKIIDEQVSNLVSK